jgi:chromosome partitioning protein
MASAGKKVLLVDCDLNNSLSYHYLDRETMERTKKLNIASALSDEENDLGDFAVPTRTNCVDLIASMPYLSDLRTLSEKRLKRMVPKLHGKYDAVIIDCHPTYDNIVLNALHAADFIISPVLKDLFSYNAAMFLAEVLPRDIEDIKNWYVLVNGYNRRYEDAKSGKQNEYLGLYTESGLPMMPAKCWLPWTSRIHDFVDFHKPLTATPGIPGAVRDPALYNALVEFSSCFFDGFTAGEVF